MSWSSSSLVIIYHNFESSLICLVFDYFQPLSLSCPDWLLMTFPCPSSPLLAKPSYLTSFPVPQFNYLISLTWGPPPSTPLHLHLISWFILVQFYHSSLGHLLSLLVPTPQLLWVSDCLFFHLGQWAQTQMQWIHNKFLSEHLIVTYVIFAKYSRKIKSCIATELQQLLYYWLSKKEKRRKIKNVHLSINHTSSLPSFHLLFTWRELNSAKDKQKHPVFLWDTWSGHCVSVCVCVHVI